MGFIKHSINNLPLKILALVLAVITWKLISNEIRKEDFDDGRVSPKIFPFQESLIQRKLPVKPVFVGTTPEGYEFLKDNVDVNPNYLIVAGQSSILNNIKELLTEPIDLSRIKKTVTSDVSIVPFAPNVDTERLHVEVVVPIKKLNETAENPTKN